MNLLYIGSGSGDNPLLSRAAVELHDEGVPITVRCVCSEDLDGSEELFVGTVEQIRNASFIIINLHGSVPYFKKFPRLLGELESLRAPVFVTSTLPDEMEEFHHLFRLSDEDYHLVHAYLHLGGYENMRSLLLLVHGRIDGRLLAAPEPVRPPAHGIYHPGRPQGTSPEDYLASLPPGARRAGILFWQGDYLEGALGGVDAVIASLEREGFSTIPVFCSSTPDPVSGSPGVAEIVRKYFMQEGEAVVDLLVVMMGFSQLSLSSPGDGRSDSGPENFFAELGVPVLQAMVTGQSRDDWAGNIRGLSPLDISSLVVWPEYDGQIITVPVASHEQVDGARRIRGIAERADRLAKMAKAWADLHVTPVGERKIAVLLYQYSLSNDSIGGAFGLDAPESAVRILHELREAGYDCGDDLPATGQDLVLLLLSGLTNTPECLTGPEMVRRAAGTVGRDEYLEWFSGIDPACRSSMLRDWGEPPGTVLAEGDRILIPGRRFGNVFIGLQPPRGFLEEAEAVYHSTDLVMPHQYLAYYRWLKEGFGTQAVVHLGTHGTLEWLPGKSTALSSSCYPDAVLEGLPHIYPYVIDNPGEGIQAKRRSHAVIVDHLIPAMTRAGGYGDLEDLVLLLQDYFRASRSGEEAKSADLLEEIARIVEETDLASDLHLRSTDPSDLSPHLEALYDYLCTARDSLIKDGLHIFGLVPEGERFCELLYALTRIRNGRIPSLRDAVGRAMGEDAPRLATDPSGWHTRRGMPNGAVLEEIDRRSADLIQKMAGMGCDPAKIPGMLGEFDDREELEMTLEAICTEIVPAVRRTVDEMGSLAAGLDGRYVPPGPSGAPTRGNAHLLPTGRNFYSVDPAMIPTPPAFAVGKRMADEMIRRYIAEEGVYPKNVGIVVFATDTMKTGGDDLAYLLWLMGLRPVWSAYGGRVTGLEVVPLSELQRPRIDVTLRITGLFRDVFPGLIDLIDEGVEMVASLDEQDEDNYLAAHLRRSLLDAIREGLDADEARSRALIRIFGCPPGTYGAGVADSVASSGWDERRDLADTYLDWGCHAYGRKHHGEEVRDLFKRRLSELDVTVKNHNSRELDILDNDDDFMYHGGMIAVVKEYGEKDPVSFVGDSSNPEAPVLRTVAEESRFLFRSRVLNPKWLEGLKPHRYRGAQELSALIDFAFGWDATSEILEDWQYRSLAETFLFDESCRAWLAEDNPHALMHMAGRLLEAVDRGMWEPDEETLDRLRSLYLSVEGTLESMTGPGR